MAEHNDPRRSETGATAVEYAIMVALIALVITAAVLLLGHDVSDTFKFVADAL